MADEKKKKIRTTAEWDERREKIRELIKERIKNNKPEGSIKKNKSVIEIQLEESNEKIQDLIEFGDELVTNITVAREMREIQRRKFEDAQKKALLDDLSKESAESMEKYNNISEKWAELKNYKEPVVMFHQLENQKDSINELMRSKDSIIEKCQKEIDRMSDKYYSDQEKQAAEICLMIERVDNQVELIKQAYKNHLDLLQDAIEEERLKATKTEAEQWDVLFGTIKAFEERKLNMEKERERNYMNEITQNCKEQQEITRETRIRLERDAENLQLELRNTQNNVLMNSEKMDYNFQVLKKRNEENVVINNQQKRRLAKLKETIAALKAKVASTTERSNAAVKKMMTEVGKLYDNIDHLEKKSKQFLQANDKKYQYVWSLNYQEAVSLVNRIFEIDRLLHVQQLGIEWNPIHIEEINHPKMNNTGQNNNNKKPKDASKQSDWKSSITLDNKISKASEIHLLRCILKKVSDRAGFLIEDKLIKILEPFTEEEKCLVRVDNIFDALNITEYRNVTTLIDYFLPYCWCPNCAKEVPAGYIRQSQAYALAWEKDDENDEEDEPDTWSISTDDVEHNVTQILTSQNGSDQQFQKGKGKKTCSHHYLVIKPAFVLTALRSFTENYLKKNDNGGEVAKSIAKKSSAADRYAGGDATEKCWLTFRQALTPEKKKLWKTLEHGLDHYLFILKEREQLDMECEFLRQQNTELRHLLQKHMTEPPL